jgi:hypothetical protein
MTAYEQYRAHVMGDCWLCATSRGMLCDERKRLDYDADIEQRQTKRAARVAA